MSSARNAVKNHPQNNMSELWHRSCTRCEILHGVRPKTDSWRSSMLESLKEHIRDFNSDFGFDFDLSDGSFLNWLRSLLMMLDAYWLVVAVPMAIVNHFRPDDPIGNDSFYIEYLDLRPFNFTFKYVGHTIIRILVVGLWCGLMMLYGIFIYPFTHHSAGSSDGEPGSGSGDSPGYESPRQESERCEPRDNQSRSSAPSSTPQSEPRPPSIIAAFKRGTGIYIRTDPGGDRYIVGGDGWELKNYSSDTVSVMRTNDPHHIHIYDANGHMREVISV